MVGDGGDEGLSSQGGEEKNLGDGRKGEKEQGPYI